MQVTGTSDAVLTLLRKRQVVSSVEASDIITRDNVGINIVKCKSVNYLLISDLYLTLDCLSPTAAVKTLMNTW